ncbi:MAG TPA: aminoacyl-tRNA hydrolase [Bacteroidales bacterium]|nr:aminoacyl-tRNA hydrolase [Bacteroidales bacterium]
MKYLIAGLGNIGDGYRDTRHNIGFTVLDAMAAASNTAFTDSRYGAICKIRYKGRELILLKPSTFMNLSGNAVSFWMKKENIPLENLLVIVDDLALPLGSIRMRSKGSDGGHNGLAHINSVLGTNEYARIRIGIGNDFRKGSQVDYVLGTWNPEEKELLRDRISIVIEMIKSFSFAGTELTMTNFNKHGKMPAKEDKIKPE